MATGVSAGAPRIADGALWEVVVGPGERRTQVRFERCPAGWQASFELVEPHAPDLAVVHRLVAPSLRDARAAVAPAVAFLLGRPVAE